MPLLECRRLQRVSAGRRRSSGTASPVPKPMYTSVPAGSRPRSSGPSQPRPLLRAFLAGATEPSAPALVGAVVVAALLALAGIALLTEDAMAGAVGRYFVTSITDEYARLSIEVLALERSRAIEPALLVIGSSSTREALTDERDLAERLRRRTGYPVQAHILAADNLWLWEYAALLDRLPAEFRGVVALEVAPKQLSASRERLAELQTSPRLALPSRAFDQELTLAGLMPQRRWGNYCIDNDFFFTLRLGALANLVRGPIMVPAHFTGLWPKASAIETEFFQRRERERLAGYTERRDANFAVYSRLIRRLKQHGRIAVALLGTEHNQALTSVVYGEDGAKRLAVEVEADLGAFAARERVAYWRLGAAARLEPGDFRDFFHVASPGARERYSEAVATAAAALLSQQDIGSEPPG